MKICFNDEKIKYTGRIDICNEGAWFYYASSQAEVRFTGSEISAQINMNTVWGMVSLGYVIDGREGRIPIPKYNDGKPAVYQIANSLEPDKEHTLILFKRQAANHSFELMSFECDGEFLTPAPHKKLRLEFYGDSVSAGEVSEAVDFVGRCDPASHDGIYDNAYKSYTWKTARKLDAELHNISQGGIAVFDRTGWFHGPEMIGMESVYDKLCYFPEGGPVPGRITEWDFSRYIPHGVIFALGQNDQHNPATGKDDIDIADPATREKWKNGYKKIVNDIRRHYPSETKYVFITTLLIHDPQWDRAIDEITEELKAEGAEAYHFMFTGNGAVTPGHPREQEHEKMASELAAFLGKIL